MPIYLHVLFLRFALSCASSLTLQKRWSSSGHFRCSPVCPPRHLICVLPIGLPAAHQPRKQLVPAPFFSPSLSLPELDGCDMSEHLHSGGTSGRSASVTWLARRLFDRLRGPSPTNLAALSCWRAMKTSVLGNNRISRVMQTCIAEEVWVWWGYFLFFFSASKRGPIRTGSFLKSSPTCRHPAQMQFTQLINH